MAMVFRHHSTTTGFLLTLSERQLYPGMTADHLGLGAKLDGMKFNSKASGHGRQIQNLTRTITKF
jgi:hypothetical protein